MESYALSCSSAALVAAVEFTWDPSDADSDIARQAHRCKTSDLGQEFEVAGRPRLKQSTVERLSLSDSILRSCTRWMWAARSAAFTKPTQPIGQLAFLRVVARLRTDSSHERTLVPPRGCAPNRLQSTSLLSIILLSPVLFCSCASMLLNRLQIIVLLVSLKQ